MDGLLPELCVVIKANLGIAHDNTTISELSKWVDLDHSAITLDEDLVERTDAGRCRSCLVAFETHLQGHVFCLCLGDPVHNVHWHLDDCCWVGGGNVLNGSTACLATDHNGAAATTVHEDGKVLLVFDLEPLAEHNGIARLARCAGLLRDECLAEHFICIFRCLLLLDDVDTALEVILLEVSEAPTTRQDLGLDDDLVAAEDLGGLRRFRRCLCHH
mmetsp:Transcript_37490/g.104185  ORF Transcript_37490/g.104185 Transcript_37490/m.104185 type:complete len:216 (-) Transcript_37490:221-868(-)